MVSKPKYLFFLFSLLVLSPAFGKPLKKIKIDPFEVSGIGKVRVVHDILGEPVVQPERLQVFLKCKDIKREMRFKVFRMCQWDAVEYDATVKTLTLKLIRGQVDPKSGIVKCDLIDREEIDFSQSCKTK